MLWVLIRITSAKHMLWVLISKAILMSTHNICFYGEITKFIPKLSSLSACFTVTVIFLSFRTDRPGQTVQRSSLIRVYTVCNSLCIFWMHYSKEKPSCSTFRVITTNFLGVRIFRKFMVYYITTDYNANGGLLLMLCIHVCVVRNKKSCLTNILSILQPLQLTLSRCPPALDLKIFTCNSSQMLLLHSKLFWVLFSILFLCIDEWLL